LLLLDLPSGTLFIWMSARSWTFNRRF